MCGIVASVSQHTPVERARISQAVSRLHHRGPDAQRVWVDHGRAGLGHARLSIIDLTTGDQPIANEDDQLHLVANGEFYDFERIRCELSSRGTSSARARTARSRCTCSRIRAPGRVHALRGEFAYAIWDERDDVLFAARDRFGIKPLYYTRA